MNGKTNLEQYIMKTWKLSISLMQFSIVIRYASLTADVHYNCKLMFRGKRRAGRVKCATKINTYAELQIKVLGHRQRQGQTLWHNHVMKNKAHLRPTIRPHVDGMIV